MSAGPLFADFDCECVRLTEEERGELRYRVTFVNMRFGRGRLCRKKAGSKVAILGKKGSRVRTQHISLCYTYIPNYSLYSFFFSKQRSTIQTTPVRYFYIEAAFPNVASVWGRLPLKRLDVHPIRIVEAIGPLGPPRAI